MTDRYSGYSREIIVEIVRDPTFGSIPLPTGLSRIKSLELLNRQLVKDYHLPIGIIRQIDEVAGKIEACLNASK